LTPASIRLYDFSEYKHKATSVGVKYRLKKKNESPLIN